MKMCLDCKSNHIVDVEVYQAYFREGEWIRLRNLFVFENLNGDDPKSFIASCPELSKTATAIGETEMKAIQELKQVLLRMSDGRWRCLGEKIDE